jgi:hypothetical protein
MTTTQKPSTERKPRTRKKSASEKATDAVLTEEATIIATTTEVTTQLPPVVEVPGDLENDLRVVAEATDEPLSDPPEVPADPELFNKASDETIDVAAPGDKVLKDYLWEAEQADKALDDAYEALKQARHHDKNLVNQFVAQSAASQVTVAYGVLGQKFLALEELIFQRKLTANMYHHWWAEKMKISPARHTRAKDVATYLTPDEREQVSLTTALAMIRLRKKLELGHDPDVVALVSKVERIEKQCSSVVKALEELDAAQVNYTEDDLTQLREAIASMTTFIETLKEQFAE